MTHILFALACTGDPRDSGWEPEPEPEPEPCVEDTDCASWQICEEDACVNGDRNNEPEEAQEIELDEEASGRLETDEDVDYFLFSVDEPQFVRVHTVSEDEDMSTVLTLYRPDGSYHAMEDEHPLGSVSTYDSVLYAWLPEAGAWTVAVTEASGSGSSSYAYTVQQTTFTRGIDETDSESEPGSVLEVEGSTTFYAIGWVLESDGDEDWIQLDLPYEECPLVLDATEFEVNSAADPVYELLDVDGETLGLKTDLGPGGQLLYPEVDGGQALVHIEDADGGGSLEHWGVLFLRAYSQGYSYEVEVEPNDTMGNAQLLEPVTNESTGVDEAYAWGVSDGPNDEDWFAVDLRQGQYLHVYGTAATLGSLIDGELELYSSAGELLEEGFDYDEDSMDDISQVGPFDEGRYFVRVFDADGADGPGLWYRFTLGVADEEFE